ncbi:MAG: HD domain-containing protein [Clostridia bacterium]|nr:HD domain-containing protein [Clostridia bacterium]
MKEFLPKKLITLAENLSRPLYAVGGVVRNFLIDRSISEDVDLASATPTEELCTQLEKVGLKVLAEYKRTGTVVFGDGERRYEYTTFRKEEYLGGEHTPYITMPTDDIKEDALRRDFKCNAVYYDLKNGQFVDPLDGIRDIKERRLSTADKPEKVFRHDGLRLMRLARFAGELNFIPDSQTLSAATTYAKNILEISPERIYAELIKILQSDTKYRFSDPRGHYVGLKILDVTRTLDYIFPELTDGRGMAQRADFHRYDVLEHSLRTVRHADKKVRLAALLHDIGKPFCFRRDGYYYHHFEEGERIAEQVLLRLKADKDTIEEVKFLVREHMVDLDCSMRENSVRLFLVKNQVWIDRLLLIKQADFRASLETHDIAPTLIKWDRIKKTMESDGAPFALKDLKISAAELMEIGFKDKELGKELKRLWEYTVVHPEKNNKEFLLPTAKSDFDKQKHV